GIGVFFNCKNLTSVTIGKKIYSINSFVFDGCDSLTNIYYKGNIEEWGQINGNEKVPISKLYYYIENQSDLPTDGGNYWHYVDGVPTVWTKE
ncbi:MAG: leucine-rich repeat protein, partial [Clostridia bacterium]|nr:leucine-rich repeat protein [Clostridia bacterium]